MAAVSKRYIPLGPLLSGSGSRAFLGLEGRPEGPRAVVLVWVPDDVARDSKRLVRLRRDTEQAARLDHPNIIHVYGLEDLDEGPARVVEFADGESLRRILDTATSAGRPLAPWLAARIVADACFGVHYAHKLGEADGGRPIVHGDLRPETILVSFHGIVKVTGYGAIEVAPKPEDVSPAAKRVYLSPEQVVGGIGVASRATDLYALGAILYETIAGKPPFVDEPDLDLAILTKQPPPLTVAGVPDALGQVVTKAMAKRSVDRFPTALAMREAIEASFALSTASPVDVATLLAQLFPANSGEREARRQLLASALSPSGLHVIPDSEFELIPAPAGVESVPATPSVSPASVSGTVAAATQTAPAAVTLSVKAASPARLAGAKPRRSGVFAPLAVAGILAGLALGVFLGRGSFVIETGKEVPIASSSPGPRAATANGTASRPETLARAPDLAAAAQPAGKGDSPQEEVDAATVARRDDRRPAILSVDSEPEADVFVDGKRAGRAPVQLLVEPGRHRIRVADKEKGIESVKSITVEPFKRTAEKFTFGVAMLTITAPPGAEIVIDGRRIGIAPLREAVTIFEGTHKVRATLGDRQPLEEELTVHSGERLTFDIEPTE